MEDDDGTTTSSLVVDLYCHEAPLLMVSTPPSTEHGDYADHQQQVQDLLLDNDDDESLISEYMARQRCYAPSRSYLDHLRLSASSSSSSSLPDDGISLSYARSRGVHYIIYAFGRLGLAASTPFNAVNFLDRFLAINCHIQKWETWMIELVSLACLSIACKLDEVNIPSLHQLQMEEVMSHSFRPATIRDMELTLLKALQWRIACVTPFSFLQLLLPLITCTAAASRCARLLICSLSETSLLRFDPSVIASSAIRCVMPQNHHQAAHVSSHINGFFFRPECPLEKDSDECLNTMKTLYASLDWSNHQMYSSDLQRSPVSVFPCFGITESTVVVNRSAISRCLFGKTIPHQVSTEDEDSVLPSDTYTRDEVISNI